MYDFLLERIINKKDLSIEEAETLMNSIMDGKLNEAEIASFLVALRMKEESEDEIAAFANVMRKKAVHFHDIPRPVLDIVGTGGDGAHTINISTLSALTIASMGYSVAKHGNYSVSSKSGAADIMERLGYPLKESLEEASLRLREKKFVFLFAPMYHPAMKFVAPVRKNMKVRTVFNILGPLTNPAEAEIMLLGVYHDNLLKKMARALDYMNVKNFMVIHSEDKMDEISPFLPTRYILKDSEGISEGKINPSEFPLSIQSLKEIQVENPDDAYNKAIQIIDGNYLPGIEAVALNTSFALALIQNNQNVLDFNIGEAAKKNYSTIIKHIENKNLKTFIDTLI